MFRVTRRVYRTTEGRLVEEGDLEAAFLAYAVGDEVSDQEARRVGLAAFLGAKAKAKPADKAIHRADDKAGGGLSITRTRDKEQNSG
jgi:hypothetical protein